MIDLYAGIFIEVVTMIYSPGINVYIYISFQAIQIIILNEIRHVITIAFMKFWYRSRNSFVCHVCIYTNIKLTIPDKTTFSRELYMAILNASIFSLSHLHNMTELSALIDIFFTKKRRMDG